MTQGTYIYGKEDGWGAKGFKKKKTSQTHLVGFGAILLPTGRRQHVRFLRRRMDALVAEVDYALAYLLFSPNSANLI